MLEECTKVLLKKACTDDDVDSLNLLIEKGLDIRNYRLIRLGLEFNDSIFVDVVSRGKLEMAKRLLELGADVNCKSSLEKRPIFIAAEAGSIEMFKLLVDNGADCWLLNRHRNSLAHYACSYNKDDNFLRYFAESGVDFNCKNALKETPLLLAAKHRNLVAVKFLLSQKVDVNVCDSSGNSPLHICILSCLNGINVSIAEGLIKSGANVNAKNHRGQTPLHLIYPNTLQLITPDNLNETVALFLDNGADILALDNLGNSTFKFFHRKLNEKLTKEFIKKGADLKNIQ